MENNLNQSKIPSGEEKTAKTTIFYYTGTGNSLWAARALAQKLGNTELISITNQDIKNYSPASPVIGLAFPVHIWGVPRRVLEFLDQLKEMSPQYIFAVATNGGQVSNTLVQLQKVMKSKGLLLSSGWSIVLPSNYIPWGGPGSDDEKNTLFAASAAKITVIAKIIKQQVTMPVEKGPLWQRIVFSWLYDLSFAQVPRMDAKFMADERCNNCGICIKLCPRKNIIMQDEKLIWQHDCEQCLACIQWCPNEALQYGKKTAAYSRYHHPEIKISDLLK